MNRPIHQRTAGIWSKLHDPKSPVMLKDLSDNLKNYAIAGATFSLGVKLLEQAQWYAVFSGVVLSIVAIAFFFATVLQTLVLTVKQSQAALPFTVYDRIRYGFKSAAKVFFYLSVPMLVASAAAAAAFWWSNYAI